MAWTKLDASPYTVTSGNVTLSDMDKLGKYAFAKYEAPAYAGLTFTANTAGSTVAMSISGATTLGLNFSYSTDNSTWNTFTPGTTTVTLTNAGDKVYFKGNNPNGVSESWSAQLRFVMTGSVAASGNIMSLIDNGTCTTLAIPNEWCFYGLFQNCTALTTPPELPATNLYDKNNCYGMMFKDCTALTSAPALPSNRVPMYGYANMFQNCTSLTTPPALPGTILDNTCYAEMFEGCTSLTSVPALPATSVPWQGYCYMFYGCTSLYVSDTLGSGFDKEWRIPTSGTFSSASSDNDDTFKNCRGTRSSDTIEVKSGEYKTYYTQNTPVV